YSLLTRSQRISHENLRLRDREWLETVERWFWAKAGVPNKSAAPMFAPFKLRELRLENRVTVSPMAMYSAIDGTPNDFHFVHYGERAIGGAGLMFTEMTCVSPEGRISPGCTGMWNDDHVAAWKRIVDFVHAQSKAKICLQLGHSGGKGSTKLGWEGNDVPLDEGNWPVMAASDVPWSPANQVPKAMTRADMDLVRDQFVAAVRMGIECGFDMVELHAAHGYLLSSFITPLQNRRTDDYGGSLENRLRYPLEVFAAMRAAWPKDRPMSVRISATDWAGEGGITPDDAVAIGEAFAREGADLIDVSAGQTWAEQQPVYGRMFQTPFSDKIRNEGRLATMAVGNIYEPDHANSILAAGRADLVALARPHLIDPMWTLRAAAQLDYRGVHVPPQYLNGMSQLARNLKRDRLKEHAAGFVDAGPADQRLDRRHLGDEQHHFAADLELAPRLELEPVARHVGDDHVERAAVAFDQHRIAAHGDARVALQIAGGGRFILLGHSGPLTHRDASAFARHDDRARFDHWMRAV